MANTVLRFVLFRIFSPTLPILKTHSKGDAIAMIKGINRQMIEVTHTGSPYFERAFLVVRADSSLPEPESLHRLAEKVVHQAETYAGLRRQRQRLWGRRVLFALCWGGGGAGLLWVLQHLQV